MLITEVPVKGRLQFPQIGTCFQLPVEPNRMDGWPDGITIEPDRPCEQVWRGAEFFPAAPTFVISNDDGVLRAEGAPLAGVLLVHAETQVTVTLQDGSTRVLGPGRWVIGVEPVMANDPPAAVSP